MDKHPEITKQYSITAKKSELVELKEENPISFSLKALELLNNYGSKMKRMNGKWLNSPSYTTGVNSTGGQELSTSEIMKVAGVRYMSSFQNFGDLSMLINPFVGKHSGLSGLVAENIELAEILLASAEKVGNQQFDRARRLLSACYHMASCMGNPVQRVVYHFAEALQTRINHKTGIISSQNCDDNKRWQYHLEEAIRSVQPPTLAYKKELPFNLVTEVVGVQAILDSMTSAKRIHLVDLAIRNGSQWTILMQALADRQECPLEMLKITAIGTTSKQMVEDTGRRLLCFAEALSLPFSFKIIMISSMSFLNEDLFEFEAGEAIGIYSSLLLMKLIPYPRQFGSLMRVIKNLSPTVMVVTEVEADMNSAVFMDRFIEALYFYSAHFDSLEACMDRCNPCRMTLEADYFTVFIQSVVAFEADERTFGYMRVDGWRSSFKKFGMVDIELSASSLYQAELVVNSYAFQRSCTLDMDGNCLLVGWKGTPLFSVSVWNFR